MTTPRLFQTSSGCNDPAKMLTQTGALVFPVKLDGSTRALKYFAKSGFNEDQDCKDLTAAERVISSHQTNIVSLRMVNTG